VGEDVGWAAAAVAGAGGGEDAVKSNRTVQHAAISDLCDHVAFVHIIENICRLAVLEFLFYFLSMNYLEHISYWNDLANSCSVGERVAYEAKCQVHLKDLIFLLSARRVKEGV